MNEEGFFDAYARCDFAHGDAGGVGLFAVGTDNGTFKYLSAELVTFLDFLGYADGVAGADVDDGFLFLRFSHLFEQFKRHIGPFLII